MKRTPRLWSGRWIILIFCAAVLIGPSSAARPFSDVPDGHWAGGYINALAGRGFLWHCGGAFRPDEATTREEFLSLLCQAAGVDDCGLEPGDGWAAPARALAGYLGWYSEEEIDWENRAEPIECGLAAKILVNALFPDEAAGGTDSLEICARLGLRAGGGEPLTAQAPLSRAEAAALVCRAADRLEASAPAKGESVQVPILMYHDVSYLGYGFSKTPEQFRTQMQELADAGFHTVTYAQLIDFVERSTPLPDKPIVITLDDGYQTNYEYVYPILKELGMTAELSVIGAAIELSEWGLKWEQVREMSESGVFAIEAHTYAMHEDNSESGGRKGALKIPAETWAVYVDTMGADAAKVRDYIEDRVGVSPVAFTYPMGLWNPVADAVAVSRGYTVTVGTDERIQVFTQNDPSSLRLLGRLAMDFRNGSVVELLNKFGYTG